MKQKYTTNFLIGLIFGAMVAAIIWYWQKSTSAEDGALALLDRLATAEKKLRRVQEQRAEGQPSVSDGETAADELQRVRGIGPVFERRLQDAGIRSIEQLVKIDAGTLAQVLQASSGRAETILSEARSMGAPA